MDWRLAVVKKALVNRMPLGRQLRQAKRQLFGYQPDTSNLAGTLAQLDRMQQVVAAMAGSIQDARVLEIGSGWFPTIPIMLSLGGAKEVLMSDQAPHMDAVTFATTLDYLRGALPDDRRLDDIRSLDDLPIRYLAPFDVDDLADGSLDLVMSRTVLEHIPPDDLQALLAALRPKLAPGALMIHLVDNSDHLEHADKSLSKINFLTWSERRHALLFRLARGGENRLRHHQYPPLFQAAGYRVLHAECDIHPATQARISSLQLAAPYADMSPEQLAALTSLFVLAPDQAADVGN